MHQLGDHSSFGQLCVVASCVAEFCLCCTGQIGGFRNIVGLVAFRV